MSDARRLHAPSLEGERIDLGPEAARHAKVLRVRAGDPLVLFDGRGREADAIVESLDPLIARVTSRRASAETARVVLVQAIPKGAKLDEIVRAATECGVTAIHLAITERTIARPEGDRALAKLDRLTKIAIEAARQSERASVPAIVPPAPLAEVCARAPDDAARLVLSPRRGVAWTDALASSRSGSSPARPAEPGSPREAWCAIGPEGGLSDVEEDALARTGWTLARLALPVLRVETAAPIAVAMIVDRLSAQ